MDLARLLPLMLLGLVTVSAEISIIDVGRYDFTLPDTTLNGLSGIAYAGDDRYWVVGDAAADLNLFAIKMDRETGRVKSVEPIRKLPLEGGEAKDREDLIQVDGEALVVNELCGSGPGPCIDRHDLKTGHLVSRTGPDSLSQLAIFKHAEHNRKFEAIAARPDGAGYWVANERAMPIDGDPATVSTGSQVRLQLLDADLKGVAQFVYVTDTIVRPIEAPAALVRHSGARVVGMVSLSDDSLIVLENSLQGNGEGLPESRLRLYEVDQAGATDVSGDEFDGGLRGKSFTPVRKRRLVELMFDGLTSNYEGITLGPRLSNGDYAVLLIRDNGRGTDQTIHSLRLRGGRSNASAERPPPSRSVDLLGAWRSGRQPSAWPSSTSHNQASGTPRLRPNRNLIASRIGCAPRTLPVVEHRGIQDSARDLRARSTSHRCGLGCRRFVHRYGTH